MERRPDFAHRPTMGCRLGSAFGSCTLSSAGFLLGPIISHFFPSPAPIHTHTDYIHCHTQTVSLFCFVFFSLFLGLKIQHPKNWVKSKLAEVEKKKLAELEIGRPLLPQKNTHTHTPSSKKRATSLLQTPSPSPKKKRGFLGECVARNSTVDVHRCQ